MNLLLNLFRKIVGPARCFTKPNVAHSHSMAAGALR